MTDLPITTSRSKPKATTRPHPPGRPALFPPAYTLVELFLTLAVLMIVLGLMINLSNRVRRESADKATRKILAQLTVMMSQYRRQNSDAIPPVSPLIDSSSSLSESNLQAAAVRNSSDVVRFLKFDIAASSHSAENDLLKGCLVDGVMQDPWGSPIVFMPAQNPAIGMAPSDAFFFFSAGPDRQFLTREDNVYSYEQSPNAPGSANNARN